MSAALWRVRGPDGPRLARGPLDTGPAELLAPDLTVASLLRAPLTGGPALADLARLPGEPLPGPPVLLCPLDGQPVWAAGVTFPRSRTAREEESRDDADVYARVYAAERPELFLKALPGTSRGPDDPVTVRADSSWTAPEPELGVLLDATGVPVGYLLGDDVTARSIEASNPLYLPQAKVWDGSCAVGPAIVPAAAVGDHRSLVVRLAIHRGGAVLYEDAVPVGDMVRTVPDLVAHLTRHQTFPHGVLLLTGTSIVPPEGITLVPGDRVDISAAGLGTLSTPVEAAVAGPPRPRGGRAGTPREVAERYWAAETARDLEGILDCFHDDAVFRAGAREWAGRDAIRERYAGMAAEYPGLRVTVTDEVTDGDRSALAWRAVLVDPEGRETTLTGVNLVRVRAGRFTRVDCSYDPGGE